MYENNEEWNRITRRAFDIAREAEHAIREAQRRAAQEEANDHPGLLNRVNWLLELAVRTKIGMRDESAKMELLRKGLARQPDEQTEGEE